MFVPVWVPVSMLYTSWLSVVNESIAMLFADRDIDDVYCHGTLAGVAYVIEAFNPDSESSSGTDGDAATLTHSFFYHLSYADQIQAVVSLVLLLFACMLGVLTLSVGHSLIKRNKLHTTVKLVLAAVVSATPHDN